MNTKTIKLVIIGSINTGKTSLIYRLKNNSFNTHTENTIGAAFTKLIHTHNPSTYNIECWDTAGSERYAPLLPLYVRGAHIVLLCYDNWNANVIKDNLKYIHTNNTNTHVVMCRTKSDLITPSTNDDVRSRDTINAELMGWGKVHFVSSKTGDGISDLLNSVCNYIDEYIPNTTVHNTSHLSQLDNEKMKSKSCSC